MESIIQGQTESLMSFSEWVAVVKLSFASDLPTFTVNSKSGRFEYINVTNQLAVIPQYSQSAQHLKSQSRTLSAKSVKEQASRGQRVRGAMFSQA